MIQRVGIFLILFQVFNSQSQTSFFAPADSLNKVRAIGTGVGVTTVWAGSMIGLSQVWYKEVDKTSFHSFDDSHNWMQMDKAGHVYTANKIANLCGDLFSWSGIQNNKSAWAGFGIGLGYQTTLEIFDGFSKEWGFSWSDMGANLLGASTYLGQQLGWQEQRIVLKFSAHPTDYAQYRPEILGKNFTERLLKDYNGQTYWLSASPGSFMKNSNFPKWLCFSVGYSIDQKLVGDQDSYIYYSDPELQQSISFSAKRQLLFSLDIDFSQFNIKKPWLKALVKQFNYLKLPFPALIITDGKIGGSWVYF